MNEESLRRVASSLRVGNKLVIEWVDISTREMEVESEPAAVVVDVSGNEARIFYPSLNDTFSFPPNDEKLLIFRAEVVAYGDPEFPQIADSTQPISNDIQHLVYCDGGSTAGGASASGLCVRSRIRGVWTTVLCVAKFFPHSTSACAEWIALVAALRYAKSLGEKALILTNSRQCYQQIRGEVRRISSEFVCYQRMSREEFAQCADRVTLARMFRTADNLGDSAVKRAIRAGANIGEPSAIFEESPIILRQSKQRTLEVPATPAQVSSTVWDAGRSLTLDQFLESRMFKAKPYCPRACLPGFASIVRTVLEKAVDTTCSMEDRCAALRTFLVLPPLFLPASASTSRTTTHIFAKTPFALKKPGPNGKPLKAVLDPRTRTEKTVERLVKNFQVANAARAIIADSDPATQSVQDPSADFEVKFQKLSQKFVQKHVALDEPPTMASTPPFSSHLVISSIRKMNASAANCIDAWSKRLLSDLVESDPVIAELLGILLARINDSEFDDSTMDIVKAARLIGLPKPEGGVRPVVISSVLLKLLGSMILVQCPKPSEAQFAASKRCGGSVVVHRARKLWKEGKSIIKLDSSNAFNVCPRKLIQSLLDMHDMPQALKRYFHTVYARDTVLATYGPKQVKKIMSEEGLRQGDALSTLLFCYAMDAVMTRFYALLEQAGISADSVVAMLYVDDITVACHPAEQSKVLSCLTQALCDGGFHPNLEKSAILTRDPSSVTGGIPVKSEIDFFRILGASITDNHGDIVATNSNRINLFFDALINIRIHPGVKFTILRFCGKLKLSYLCQIMEPGLLQSLLSTFHERTKQLVESLCDAPVKDELLYDNLGCGMIDYREMAPKLYQKSVDIAFASDVTPAVRLTTNTLLDPNQRSQHDAQFLFYAGSYLQLTPMQFSFALAMRLRTLPSSYRILPVTCGCGRLVRTEVDAIDHFVKCDLASTVTKSYRHTAVKSAIITTCQHYGISVTNEPRLYEALYTNEHKRPDILFHVHPPVVTDVSIVHPEVDVGVASQKAAVEKIKQHREAVTKFGHVFLPFVLETFGHVHHDVHAVVRHLASALPPVQAKYFSLESLHAVSSALAIVRVEAVRAAFHRIGGRLGQM